MKRIKDIYTDYKNNNYFFDILLQNLDIGLEPSYISKFYFASSLNRIITPFLEEWYNDNDMIANILLGTYKKKWEQSIKVIKLEYEPAYNYDMVEKGVDVTDNNSTIKQNENGDNTVVNNTTNKNTITYGKKEDSNNKEVSNISVGGDGTNNKYGMNSNTAHPDTSYTNKETTSNNNTIDETKTLSGSDITDVINNNETTTKNILTRNTEDVGKTTLTHELTRKGNIGVTTTQQMIQSDINLWKWLFLPEFIKDINNLLTLPIY